MTIVAVRLETIHRQTKMNTRWVPCKFRIKMVKSLPSLTIYRMGRNIGIFSFMFPFLIMPPHLLRCFFEQEQPFQPWRDRHVMKLFGHHFCGNRVTIIVSHLHISGPTTMYTFGGILVLPPEQHAIFSHTSIFLYSTLRLAIIFLDWYKSFGMLCFIGMRSIISLTISL
jgi:hypothetical protein